MQYANSIDDYVRIIKEGNNGGYANDWLIGDRKTGEIAYLELGLKNTPLWRTKDGYFVSSNFARDPKVIKEETTFDPADTSSSPECAARALGRAHEAGQGQDRRQHGRTVSGRPRGQLREEGAAERTRRCAGTWMLPPAG